MRVLVCVYCVYERMIVCECMQYIILCMCAYVRICVYCVYGSVLCSFSFEDERNRNYNCCANLLRYSDSSSELNNKSFQNHNIYYMKVV